jgi:surface antigen
MKRMLVVLYSTFALALSGCATGSAGPKETAGTLIGAAGGGLLGAQVGKGRGQLVAVAVGTLAGASDRPGSRPHPRSRGSACGWSAAPSRPSNTTAATRPAPGTTPTAATPAPSHPVRTYQAAQGQHCREYQQTVTIGGQPQQAYGTACRQPDGSWLIVR